MSSKAIAITLLALLMGLGSAATWAQSAAGLSLDWWTVDGGGASGSAAGGYVLHGTIGQPDAGTLSAGGMTLQAGYWGSVPRAAMPAVYLPLTHR